ncbi:hypothetical protein PORY_002810 [Pneumocystis oryctolagi]|uniref:Uncharacterized protein n=1 Tax=Pneumocystis oryctolagi TaxID=42067 RepID=A0ACB7C8P6_9ASCO|nr:hypothetical protein PORY_002810 [Pneumocystis oryctolagi]
MSHDEVSVEMESEHGIVEAKDLELKKIQDEVDNKELLEIKDQDDSVVYNVGDLVLAKISGYPWWPGMIFPEDVVPKDVRNARPVSKKRKGGAEVKYWLIRFFPEPEYIWATKSDIRPLTSKMIDDFLSKKASKKDIRESYKIAKTCPTVEDLLAQQSFKQSSETEEDNDEDEMEDDEEEFNDDDNSKNEDVDNENIKKKNALKRKTESRKVENKKKVRKSGQNKAKLNDQGKILPDKSKEVSSKFSKEKSSTEECSVSSEQLLQTKWEQKKQQILFLRHKLQRIMLTTGKNPSEADMPVVSEQLKKLEAFKEIDAAILQTTKIGKVLKRIIQLSDIPSDEKYSIKERSEKLLVFWKDLLEKSNDNTAND